MERLANTCVNFVSLPAGTTPCSKGVRYFVPKEGIELLKCAMDTVKEGQKYKKRIVVRPSRRRKGLHELYTYHFPTHWSAGCVANRELMAEARRQAHAIERDRTRAGLEWRIRFLKNYYSSEPEVKRYSRLFHFAYAVIQKEIRAIVTETEWGPRRALTECTRWGERRQKSPVDLAERYRPLRTSCRTRADEVTFEPIMPHRHRHFWHVRWRFEV